MRRYIGGHGRERERERERPELAGHVTWFSGQEEWNNDWLIQHGVATGRKLPRWKENVNKPHRPSYKEMFPDVSIGET